MKIPKKDWCFIILGLRKKLNLSHNRLGELLNIQRKSIGRYEESSRIPSDNFKLKILDFISKQKFNLNKLKKLGIKRYEAKIEKEGLMTLINMINKEIEWDIQKARLPFLWDNQNNLFLKYINKDLEYFKALNIRKQYK